MILFASGEELPRIPPCAWRGISAEMHDRGLICRPHTTCAWPKSRMPAVSSEKSPRRLRKQYSFAVIHPGEFPEISEVEVFLKRLAGDDGSWHRLIRTFL